MSKLQPQPHLDAIREQLLPLMLADAAFDGWTDAGLQQCAQKLKLDPGAVELAVPRGCIDLIRYWANCNDQAMLDAWAKTKPRLKKIREKAVFLVRSRIVAVGENNREAARRALARLALPGTSGEALAMAWASADAMWRAMNDTSTDYNYYTKRLILSGVFISTFQVWLQGDDDKAWAFLDHRISNVMQFEGFKAKMRNRAETWPDPTKFLARLRYGTGRTRPRRM
ncbi:MAG: COQ9 family protein [Robiginitomaculum sp.]|nr:COQ9 family protein [Robiginitomaculum sp.]